MKIRVLATFVLAAVVAFSLVLTSTYRDPETATAQEWVDVRWVLDEVRSNEFQIPAEQVRDVRVTVSGKSTKALEVVSGSASSGAISWEFKRTDLDGDEFWIQSTSIQFAVPPSEFPLNPPSSLKLDFSGTITCRTGAGVGGPASCIDSVNLTSGITGPDGAWTRQTDRDQMELGERTDYSTSQTMDVRISTRLTLPISDSKLRVEVAASRNFTNENGERDQKLTVAWIYSPVLAGKDEPTPTAQPGGPTGSSPTPTPHATATAPPFIPSGPLNSNCEIMQDEFDRTWRDFSDIDDAIPLEERGFEARQWSEVAQQIVDRQAEGFLLQRDMEMDRLMRLEMRRYKEALVQGIKTNLLKAFWRLAWVTWDTVKAGTGLGKSYAKLTDSAQTGLQQFGNALKVVKGLTPPKPTYSAETKRFTDRVKELGLAAALESLTADNPLEAAGGLIQETIKQSGGAAGFPSADITAEEISVLQTQHLENRVLDRVLEESYRLNSQRRLRLEALQAEISTLQPELERWENEEKARVARSIIAGCEAQAGR